MDTTSEMLAYLQQLRAKVSEAEQGRQHTVSDSENEDDLALKPEWGYSQMPLRQLERSVNYTNGDTYKGSMLGDQRHGQGTHTTSTGDVYSGNWQYDKRHGQGTFKAASGIEYEGSWADDKASGSGRCTYPDGSVYEGDWEADERSGWGTLTAADGQSYEGEWAANAPHGEGQWTFADGSSYFRGTYKAGKRVEGRLVLCDAGTGKPAHTYTGRFKDDMRHDPQGVGVEEGLWVYRGSWKADARWGEGQCRYTDGSVYAGQWVKDQRHGTGRMPLPDGTVYEGEWQDDKLHGVAKAKYASGEMYHGHWQSGQRHGHGKWSSAPTAPARPVSAAQAVSGAADTANSCGSSGSTGIGSTSSSNSRREVRETYVGAWVAGKREGQGVAVNVDGGRYEGQWKGGRRHGHGLMVFADGTVFRGAWEEDEWLQSAAELGLCRMNGVGLQKAVAGQRAEFVVQARDELSNPRLNGGDDFRVLLVPAESPHSSSGITARLLPTAPAATMNMHSPSAAMNMLALPTHAVGNASVTTQVMPMGSAGLTSYQILNWDGSGSSDSSGSSSADAVSVQSGYTSSSSSSDASVGMEAYLPRSGSGRTGGLWEGPLRPNMQAGGPADGVLEAVAAGDVQDNSDGTYSCSYTYTVAGSYHLHVTNGEGEHVAGSPCLVQVHPGPPSARHSTVTGPGRRMALAGSRAEFTVVFRDAYGNACATPSSSSSGGNRSDSCGGGRTVRHEPSLLEARLVGSNTISVATADVLHCSDGTFSCFYTAPASEGLYVLEVTYGGKHIAGSPFSVKVSTASEPQTLSNAAAARAAAAAAADHPSSPSNSTSGSNTSGTPHGDSNTPKGHSHRHRAAHSTAAGSAVVQDKVAWWGDVAREAYEAIDGCLQGFEDAGQDKTVDTGSAMLGAEADMVKANPSLPVVERLEDLWLLSRLQQERKAQQQQQQRPSAAATTPSTQASTETQPAAQTAPVASPQAERADGLHQAERRQQSVTQQQSTAGHPDDVVQRDTDNATADIVIQASGGGVAAPEESWLYDLD